MSDDPLSMPEKISSILQGPAKDKLKSLWGGDVPLFQTYWLYFFLTVFALQLLGQILFSGFFGILALFWSGFMVKPIIAAADKYTGEPLFALLAKISAVLIAMAVLTKLIL